MQFQNLIINIWACVLKIFSSTTTFPFALSSYKIKFENKVFKKNGVGGIIMFGQPRYRNRITMLYLTQET